MQKFGKRRYCYLYAFAFIPSFIFFHPLTVIMIVISIVSIGDQKVLFSGVVAKVNTNLKLQDRTLLITEKVPNLLPTIQLEFYYLLCCYPFFIVPL